ncbi:esterase [Pusillimonas sp. SM2304]|uniref:esterase n=1 Tax=Pusillimonas sp. SM2304 TaxID=3073241 RepID=UPI00287517F8|nr:esterase [Pusillimonas sp. SM2304]MDS1141630.1 esterase [Pusillimonas sp. SM2304]
MATKPDFPDPFVFVPRQGKPQLLFVLLHGESAGPEQLMPLADALKQAFPLSLVVLPYAFEPADSKGSATGGDDAASYYWVDPVGLDQANYAGRVAQKLPELIRLIRQIQEKYQLSGQQTALAGFSQGASMALEACHAQPDLAGRVLAFSGLYAKPPADAPPATMLHFFHGAGDQQVSVDEVESTLVRLGELQGDATLDVASRIGHELHDALIKQAVVRLQTCVPLRNWEAALGALEAQARDPHNAAPPSLPIQAGRTLH